MTNGRAELLTTLCMELTPLYARNTFRSTCLNSLLTNVRILLLHTPPPTPTLQDHLELANVGVPVEIVGAGVQETLLEGSVKVTNVTWEPWTNSKKENSR